MEFPADDILLQVTPQLPISDVWEGLIRPEHLEKWFAPRVHLEPYEGGAFELFWDEENPPKN
ncbi:MAG: SRPBCC domain-containing protein [Nitrososphaerota archaeon]|nr:SRPBCC domain-containing protein [Nitrososphaerota archaeon]